MSVSEEQLSAFLDDELDEAQCELLIRRLTADDDLRDTALRFSLIGDAMREELSGHDPVALSNQVRESVAAESARPRPAVARRGRWMRGVAGAAVAAGVAVVAVLSLQQTAVDGTEDAAITVPLSATGARQAAPSYTVPAALSRRAGGPDQLSKYYLLHSEYAGTMGGQAPLARIVSSPAREDEAKTEETTDESEDGQSEAR